MGSRTDVEQTLLQSLDLYATNGLGCCHKLSVAVGYAHAVRIDHRDVPDAASHKALGAPRANATHAEYYHLYRRQNVHLLRT
jgi:hypothetical protein